MFLRVWRFLGEVGTVLPALEVSALSEAEVAAETNGVGCYRRPRTDPVNNYQVLSASAIQKSAVGGRRKGSGGNRSATMQESCRSPRLECLPVGRGAGCGWKMMVVVQQPPLDAPTADEGCLGAGATRRTRYNDRRGARCAAAPATLRLKKKRALLIGWVGEVVYGIAPFFLSRLGGRVATFSMGKIK